MKLSYHIIKADDGPLTGSMAPMVYLGMYGSKDLNTGKIIPEESFMNAYAEEIH